MKIIILNHETAEVDVITLPKKMKNAQSEEIENYLYENKKYKISGISWMAVDNLQIRVL